MRGYANDVLIGWKCPPKIQTEIGSLDTDYKTGDLDEISRFIRSDTSKN